MFKSYVHYIKRKRIDIDHNMYYWSHSIMIDVNYKFKFCLNLIINLSNKTDDNITINGMIV